MKKTNGNGKILSRLLSGDVSEKEKENTWNECHKLLSFNDVVYLYRNATSQSIKKKAYRVLHNKYGHTHLGGKACDVLIGITSATTSRVT